MTTIQHITGSRDGESFEIRPARYAKGRYIVTITKERKDGWKGRADWLLEALGGRYTHRERGYHLSQKAAIDFALLFSAGFEAEWNLGRGTIYGSKGPEKFRLSRDDAWMPRKEAVKLAAIAARQP